jgi:hypothetical protein
MDDQRRKAETPAADKPRRCFVAMPFGEKFDPLYKAIEPAVERRFGKGSCSRGDTRRTAQVVSDRIIEEIIWADVVIGVITGNNANVMYEIGIAHTLRKLTLLLHDKQSDTPIPFDLLPHERIDYELPASPQETDLRRLQSQLDEYLVEMHGSGGYEASNVLTRLLGRKYHPYVDDFRIDDFRNRSGWLFGYLDVLERESKAKTVWEINPDSHWLAEDPLFFDRIKAAIKDLSRKYYYIVPNEAKEVGGMKNALREIGAKLDTEHRKRLVACMKYVAIDPAFFELMPFSVVIYNAMSSPKEAILLEPMAAQIGEDEFDGQAAKDRLEGEQGKPPHRWEEATFDVRISDRDVIVSLIETFRRQWNAGIENECKGAATERERKFLRDTWYIPE